MFSGFPCGKPEKESALLNTENPIPTSPFGPVAPVLDASPGMPCGPVLPVAPVFDASPEMPCGPVLPVAPVLPLPLLIPLPLNNIAIWRPLVSSKPKYTHVGTATSVGGSVTKLVKPSVDKYKNCPVE